jgi:hypothetical protein
MHVRYMIMHKTTSAWEAGAKPTAELAQRVGEMVGELKRSGVLVAGEGLGPSSQGARVRLEKGAVAITPGPFGRDGALPARYLMFRSGTIEQAADVGARLGRILGDVVVDVRPVNEPWDLGFAPRPDGLTTRRYMAVVNADEASESGAPLAADRRAALESLAEELRATDALLGLEHFEPTRKAKRLTSAKASRSNAKHVVLDGPFTETKELIGGFVVVEVPSIGDALAWALKYAEAVDVEEIDVRGLAT